MNLEQPKYQPQQQPKQAFTMDAATALDLARKSGFKLTYWADGVSRLPDVEALATEWVARWEEAYGRAVSDVERAAFVVAVARQAAPWPVAFNYLGQQTPADDVLAMAEAKARRLLQMVAEQDRAEREGAEAACQQVRTEVECLLEAARLLPRAPEADIDKACGRILDMLKLAEAALDQMPEVGLPSFRRPVVGSLMVVAGWISLVSTAIGAVLWLAGGHGALPGSITAAGLCPLALLWILQRGAQP